LRYLCSEITIILILYGSATIAAILLYLDQILLLPCLWKQSH